MGDYYGDYLYYGDYPDSQLGSSQRRRNRPGGGSPQRRSDGPHGYGDQAIAASGGGDCCPHVVDPLLFTSVLAAVPIVTFFIRQAITMNIMGRRKRSSKQGWDFFNFDLDRWQSFVNAGKFWLILLR